MATKNITAPQTFAATHRGMRQSARKARLVMDLVRGKPVREALNILKFTHNRAARSIEKLIASAIANAEDQSNRNNLGVDGDDLVVYHAVVGDGIRFTRWRPRSRGSSSPYQRYFCNLSVELCRSDDVEALKLYSNIKSQKRRVDRIKDLKGLGQPAQAASKEND